MSPSAISTDTRADQSNSSEMYTATRTQSLPVKADGRRRSLSNASTSSITSDDTIAGSAGSSRRVPNWLRSMGHKISGSQMPHHPEPQLPGSPGSSHSEFGGPDTGRDSASLVGKLRKFSFAGQNNTSDAPTRPMSPPNSAGRRSSLAGVSGHTELPNPSSQSVNTTLSSSGSKASKNGPSSGSAFGRAYSVEHSFNKPLNPGKNRLTELDGLSRRRVMFAGQVYMNDPPQQIPPLHAKRGNVDFSNNGELLLSLQDRPREFDFPPYLERNHAENAKTASARAHEQATRLHSSMTKSQLSIFSRFGSNDDDDAANAAEDIVATYNRVDVDGNSHAEHDTSKATAEYGSDAEEDKQNITPTEMPTPEQIYTRCCHLREILPIKSTLKQLKDQTAPITQIYLANSKPTMIEILALSDFLAIVPVAWLQLDNTVLPAAMVRLLLIALRHSKHLGKVSFLNTQFDEMGWKYLCLFVANNTSVMSLDISCDPKKSRLPAFNRRDCDWGLFSRALEVHEGGPLHLALNEVKISSADLKQVLRGYKKKGAVLEMARNDLDRGDISNLVEWMEDPETECEAINLAGNDMSELWDLFFRLISLKRLTKILVADCGLNPPSADDKYFSADIAKNSRLVWIDVSGNINLVPTYLPSMVKMLPDFPSLSRFETARCGLSSDQIVNLCEAVVDSPKLTYLNLLENQEMNESAQAALCVAVSMSHTLTAVEVDTANWSPVFRKQMATYSLRNLERAAKGLHVDDEEGNSEMRNFKRDLSLLTSEVVKRKVEEGCPMTAEKLVTLRQRLRVLLQGILNKRAQAPLSVSEREDLIRLYFYDASLDRLFRQFCANSGTTSLQAQNEEAVSAFDNNLRPSLSRKSSAASLLSLRQQEHDEGVAHKLNTYVLGYLHDHNSSAAQTAEAVDLLLGKNESPQETIRRVQKLDFSDLEKLIN